MVTPRVTFYETTLEGQRAVGTVTLEGGKPVGGGDMGERAVELLLSGVGDDAKAVREAMRLAPERFDGVYLRASYDEDGEAPFEEGGPESGHHGHKGIPGYQGGSMAGGGAMQFGPAEPGVDDEHIQAFCEKRSLEQAENLTPEEQEAVEAYTNFAFSMVNDCMRRRNCSDEDQAIIDRVEGAIERGELDREYVVYRGMQKGSWSHMGSGKRAEGWEVQDRAFTSTSLNPALAAEFAGDGGELHRITVEKGMKGLFVNRFNENKDDCEILLQRGGYYQYTGQAAEKVAGRVVHEWHLYQSAPEEV